MKNSFSRLFLVLPNIFYLKLVFLIKKAFQNIFIYKINNLLKKKPLKESQQSLFSSVNFEKIIAHINFKWINKKAQRLIPMPFIITLNKIPKKDHLLVSIKEFLEECLIYESLPQNSQVIIVDKSFSCLDTFKVFVDNDCVDCVTWNSNIAFFERILTYTDICEVIVKVFSNILCKINNKECTCLILKV